MKAPIVNAEFLLQKMPGKGGWTFAVVPNISFKQPHSMWAKVKGKIDSHEFESLSLARIKDGNYFFPVKAEIRKALKKQAGDTVNIVLFEDFSEFTIPNDIIECLKIEHGTFQMFCALSKSNQRQYVKWILSAKQDETKASRINILIDKLLKGEA